VLLIVTFALAKSKFGRIFVLPAWSREVFPIFSLATSGALDFVSIPSPLPLPLPLSSRLSPLVLFVLDFCLVVSL